MVPPLDQILGFDLAFSVSLDLESQHAGAIGSSVKDLAQVLARDLQRLGRVRDGFFEWELVHYSSCYHNKVVQSIVKGFAKYLKKYRAGGCAVESGA
jgi:hypothetical protein